MQRFREKAIGFSLKIEQKGIDRKYDKRFPNWKICVRGPTFDINILRIGGQIN